MFLGFCFRNTGLSRCIGFNLVTNTKTAGCRAAVQRPSPRGRGGLQLRQHHQDPALALLHFRCQGLFQCFTIYYYLEGKFNDNQSGIYKIL